MLHPWAVVLGCGRNRASKGPLAGGAPLHAVRFPAAIASRKASGPCRAAVEIDLDLMEEVRRLLPLLEACEEIEPGESGENQNGAEPCRPV